MMKFMRTSSKNIKAFIFDLDHVLYNENLYYFVVFEEMCSFLGLNSKDLNLMKETYKKIRLKSKDILGDILKSLDLYTLELQEKFFEFYKNTYKPISLYDDAKKVIPLLKAKNYKLGIITNGTIDVQKSKIKCLGIENIFDEILYAREFGKEFEKPHVKPFVEICKRLNIEPFKCTYIGDNPLTDFDGAKRAKFTTVRLLRGPYKKLPSCKNIDFEIDNLTKLLLLEIQ